MAGGKIQKRLLLKGEMFCNSGSGKEGNKKRKKK